jgi:Trk K+ transport system NAD-binding subunit
VEKITREVREDGFPKVIVRAEDENDAKLLYESGADYVLMPNFVSGHYLKKIVSKDPNLETLESLKEKDFEMIKREDIVT